MLDGFHFDISSAQAKEHFLARAAYHDAKERDYRAQLTSLGTLSLEIENVSMNPRQQLEQRAEDHKRRASIFRFRAEFIAADEVFRLKEQDLLMLEFLERYI